MDANFSSTMSLRYFNLGIIEAAATKIGMQNAQHLIASFIVFHFEYRENYAKVNMDENLREFYTR